jgi:hypothetical protein
MMAKTKDLYPPNLQGFNNLDALSGSIDEVFSIQKDIDKLLVYIIDRVDASALDFLAWQFHLEGYQFATTDAQKRAMIKKAIELHKYKGTPYALKNAAIMAGSKVLKLTEPPSTFFLSGGLTKEQKNEWLRQFDQLRIYPQRRKAKKQGMLFWKDYLGSCFGVLTDAMFRQTTRMTIYNHIKETELSTEFWDIDRIQKKASIDAVIPGYAKYASFCGRFVVYTVDTNAKDRVIHLKDFSPYIETHRKLRIRTITPGIRPVKADAEWTAVSGKAKSMFLNSARNFFAKKTDAVDRIYWLLYIYDPSKPSVKSLSPNHLGVSILGMPHHTCVAITDVTTKRKKTFRFAGDYPIAADKSYIETIYSNMRAYTRESAQVLIDTRKYRPIKARPVIWASQNIVAGQYKEVS